MQIYFITGLRYLSLGLRIPCLTYGAIAVFVFMQSKITTRSTITFVPVEISIGFPVFTVLMYVSSRNHFALFEKPVAGRAVDVAGVAVGILTSIYSISNFFDMNAVVGFIPAFTFAPVLVFVSTPLVAVVVFVSSGNHFAFFEKSVTSRAVDVTGVAVGILTSIYSISNFFDMNAVVGFVPAFAFMPVLVIVRVPLFAVLVYVGSRNYFALLEKFLTS